MWPTSSKQTRSAPPAPAAPSSTAAPGSDIAAEARRLRRLVEKQPACLLRVSIDGTLLAVNEAALGLLGADNLAQVLGRPLGDHIDSEHRSRWSEFAERVRHNGSASVDCDLVGASGDRRSVLLKGAAFLNHPDGVESVILTIRDTTESRRLERALEEEQSSRESLAETRAKLEQSIVERQRLETQLADAQTERQRLSDAVAEGLSERGPIDDSRKAELAQLQRLVEEQQLALIEKERGHRELVNTLRAEFAEAIAEQTRLARTLEERAAEGARLEAEFAATRAELGKALDKALQEQRSPIDQQSESSHQELVDLESRLSAAGAEQARLAVLLDEHQRREVERTDAYAKLEWELADARDQGDRHVADHQRAIADLDAQRAQVEAEQAHLASLLAERKGEFQRVEAERAEQAAKAAELERALAEAREQNLRLSEGDHQTLTDLEAQLAHAAVEQANLVSLLEQRDGERQRVEAERAEQAAKAAELERALAHVREQNVRLGERHRQAIAELDHTMAEAREQNARREERHQREIADLEVQLGIAVGEQTRLASLAEEREQDRQRLEARLADSRAQLERAIAEGLEQVARREHELAELEGQMSRAVAEQTRLTALLAARDNERHALEADHAAVRTRLEQLHAEEIEQARQQHGRLAHELADLQSKHDELLVEREDHHAERRRIDAELTAARAETERLTHEHAQTLLIREDEHRELVATLQAELTLSMALQKRLETEFSNSEANQKRLAAEHAAERAQVEKALGDAIVKKKQILKSLADQRIEVERVSENARALESLAAAGRLAIDVGRELQELTTEIDTRARFLLSLSALEASYRSELEALRAEAVRAASLARQFVLSKLAQPTIPFEHDDRPSEVPQGEPEPSAEIL